MLEGGDAEPAPLLPQTEPYPIEHKREDMRGRIAAWLVGLLGFVIVGAYVTIWVQSGLTDAVKDILTLVLSPVSALVGSATGYYFGGQTRPRDNPPNRTEDHA